MNELALFAGAGGGILGGKLLGWRTVCAVELDDYCRRVLMQRQDDGILEPFPIWDDMRTFDGKPWRGVVDIITGGFPCQDISVAGRGVGISGERSGLWTEMARTIREVGPRYVLVENSPMLTARGLGRVVGDLAAMGYDARWGVLGAFDAGAPHRRARIWLLADADRERRRTQQITGSKRENTTVARNNGEACSVADTEHDGRNESAVGASTGESKNQRRMQQLEGHGAGGSGWWTAEPDVGRVADGVASRVDRLRCLGNGQVPAVVRLAWETLTTP